MDNKKNIVGKCSSHIFLMTLANIGKLLKKRLNNKTNAKKQRKNKMWIAEVHSVMTQEESII